MFESELSKASLLQNIVDSVKDLITEAEFDISKQGISMQSMDSSHVSLVSLLLRGGSNDFTKYRCDRNVNLGVSMKNLSNVLKCAGKDDVVKLRCDDQPDKLHLTFENEKNNKHTEFGLKLMDIDAEHLGIPESKYMATVCMSSTEFRRICNDLKNFGETVTISATKEGVKFSTAGESGSGSISLRQGGAADDKTNNLQVTIVEPVVLNFALNFLIHFTKATPLSEMVILNLSSDSPLSVEYRMADDIGYLRYYLAPKIDDDEDEDMED